MGRMRAKGRRVAIAVSLLGIVTIAWAVWGFRVQAAERWYLWRLENGDPRHRALAAKELAAYPSERVVVALMQASLDEKDAGVREEADRALETMSNGSEIESLIGSDAPDASVIENIQASVLARLFPRMVAAGNPRTEKILVRWIARSYLNMLKDLGVKDYPTEPSTYADLDAFMRRAAEALKAIRDRPKVPGPLTG